jgi:site-specific DNA-methyltransferase (cytosine-N4-specific)
MYEGVAHMHIAERLGRQFTTPVPLFLMPETDAIKLEIKPYLQPFEQQLAIRELAALIGPKGRIEEKYGYHLAYTKRSEELLRERLTYWQRLGRTELVPTVQKTLEFTQSGLESVMEGDALHNARRLRYGPHDLHEYRGKFFPQLVRSLINISGVADDGIICDPMCGSGTTACEAIAASRSAIAADLNPLSALITRVKAGVVLQSAEMFRRSVNRHLDGLELPSSPRPEAIWQADVEYLRRWFSAEALKDLAAAISAIRAIRKPFYREFFSVCISNIVRSVSWQKDVDLRVRKEVKPYEAGEALRLFKQEVQDQLDRIYPYLVVLPRSAEPNLEVRQGNAVDISAVFKEYRRKVGLLVTSPPYATALPYIDTDRLSLIILGLLPRARHKDVETRMVGTREVSERERAESWERFLERKEELPSEVRGLIADIAEHNHGPDVGFRRRNLPALLGRYFIEMLDAMRSARQLMKSGAMGYYVVGNNSTEVDGEKLEIPTDRFLFALGERAGWKPVEMISMELLISRDIFRENRGSAEAILCFKAP